MLHLNSPGIFASYLFTVTTLESLSLYLLSYGNLDTFPVLSIGKLQIQSTFHAVPMYCKNYSKYK